jgi:hypothetical protein
MYDLYISLFCSPVCPGQFREAGTRGKNFFYLPRVKPDPHRQQKFLLIFEAADFPDNSPFLPNIKPMRLNLFN